MAAGPPLKLVLLRQSRCPECDRQGAILDEVRAEAPERCAIRDIDLEQNPDAAAYYKARTHPTLVLEKQGHEVKRWTGVTGKEELLEALRRHARPAEGARSRPPSASVSGTTSQAMGGPGMVALPPDEQVPAPPAGHEPPPMRP